ncbi:MAG: glycosyl transferase [Spirochaetales bacterium]|nr:glycosyl transferase [Spirochaetales bacterium]
MQFGFFDDKNREYVIQHPETPLPWINYLGSKDYFSIISQTAGGYHFFRDARLRRITRYHYNSVPIDTNGRLFYVRENGSVWSPAWKPVKTPLDFYECRHGMGYTKIIGRKDGLEVSLLFFVPVDKTAEVTVCTVKNTTKNKKTFSLFSAVEFCLWDALNDANNLQRTLSIGEVEIEPGVIYHKTEYRERRNHYSFYAANKTPNRFDTDRDSFFGLYNGYHEPKAVLEGSATCSIAHGWSPVGAFQFDMELDAGKEETVLFTLGYAENKSTEKWETQGVLNKTKAKNMLSSLNSEEKVFAEFKKLNTMWANLLGNFHIKSDSDKLNRMANIWNQYQCVVTFNLSRSTSLFETGIGRGIGFRDTTQDILGCIHQIPAQVRERILDVAATQLENGGAFHQYQPLTKQGNNDIGSDFNDDPLWLVLAVCAYLKETGDWKILDELVDFENNPKLAQPLSEHLNRSFSYIDKRTGPHNLPLIGRADWNDCLNLNCFSNKPGETFQTCTNKDGTVAESVFIAGLYILAGREYAELLDHLHNKEAADDMRRKIQRMNDAVVESGWDGSWYLRAYDDNGDKVGSNTLDEGKIYAEVQGIAGMAEIGKNKGLPAKALESVEEHLSTEYGIVLVDPAYSQYYLNLGEISSYPPGYKENGGIFCHNNPWITIAETLNNRPEKAWEYYKKIAPAFREHISDIIRTEPYIYTQMIAGKEAATPGEGKNSWLTGTASWSFVALSQWILGIRPHWDGLVVSPRLPGEITGFTCTRLFRGAEYEILVVRKNNSSHFLKKAFLDKKELSVNENNSVFIPFENSAKGNKHIIEIFLGE